MTELEVTFAGLKMLREDIALDCGIRLAGRVALDAAILEYGKAANVKNAIVIADFTLEDGNL